MEHLKVAKGSIEFRDAVMDFDNKGLPVYVRRECSMNPTYRVLPIHGTGMTVSDLFYATYPPINMEDFAHALVKAEEEGDVPLVEVFTP